MYIPVHLANRIVVDPEWNQSGAKVDMLWSTSDTSVKSAWPQNQIKTWEQSDIEVNSKRIQS